MRARRQSSFDRVGEHLHVLRRRGEALLGGERGELLQPRLVGFLRRRSDLLAPARRRRRGARSEGEIGSLPPRRADELEQPACGISLPLRLPQLPRPRDLALRIDFLGESLRTLDDHRFRSGEHRDRHEVRRDFPSAYRRVEHDEVQGAVLLRDERLRDVARRSSRQVLVTLDEIDGAAAPLGPFLEQLFQLSHRAAPAFREAAARSATGRCRSARVPR